MSLIPNLSTLLGDLLMFLPELVVIAGLVVLLLLRMLPGMGRSHLGGVSLTFTAFALVVSGWMWWSTEADKTTPMFQYLLAYDNLTNYLRVLVLAATALVTILTLQTGIPDAEDSADFHVLLLGGTLGMMLMGSANHLLMVYIAVEMASLPSYALAGFLKGKRRSSEAALKYVVYGGGASGVMLYGISLLAGRFGTGYLHDLALGYAAILQGQATGGVDILLVLGTLFVLIGLGFKLSAVPFHFWCPDVFEGAAAEVAAFLSVASKAGAFALTGRLLLVLATAAGHDSWLLARYFAPALALLAAATATFGNLAAYPQTNLKRLLAYSTIAHAGYMLMGVAVLTAEGAQAVLFYLATYVFMNLGAFAVVAFVRNKTGSEDLSELRGLVYRSPLLVIVLGVFLLSLLGLPPFAGFVAKVQVFMSVFHAGRDASAKVPWLGTMYYALLVIGGLNTALSAVYYVRVLKVMVIDRPDDTAASELTVPIGARLYTSLLAAAVVVLGLAWNPLAQASERGARRFAAAKLGPASLKLELPNVAGANAGGDKAKGKGKAGGKGKGKGGDKAKAKETPKANGDTGKAGADKAKADGKAP